MRKTLWIALAILWMGRLSPALAQPPSTAEVDATNNDNQTEDSDNENGNNRYHIADSDNIQTDAEQDSASADGGLEFVARDKSQCARPSLEEVKLMD